MQLQPGRVFRAGLGRNWTLDTGLRGCFEPGQGVGGGGWGLTSQRGGWGRSFSLSVLMSFPVSFEIAVLLDGG